VLVTDARSQINLVGEGANDHISGAGRGTCFEPGGAATTHSWAKAEAEYDLIGKRGSDLIDGVPRRIRSGGASGDTIRGGDGNDALNGGMDMNALGVGGRERHAKLDNSGADKIYGDSATTIFDRG